MFGINLRFFLCLIFITKIVYSQGGDPCSVVDQSTVDEMESTIGDGSRTVTLSCIVNGQIVSMYTWDFRNSSMYAYTSIDLNGDKYSSSVGELQINNVNSADEGLYQCKHNGDTQDPSMTIDLFCLNVIGYPVIIDCSIDNSCSRNLTFGESFDIIVQFRNMFGGFSDQYVPVTLVFVRDMPGGPPVVACSSSNCSDARNSTNYPNTTFEIQNVTENGTYSVTAFVSTSSPSFTTSYSYEITVNVSPMPPDSSSTVSSVSSTPSISNLTNADTSTGATNPISNISSSTQSTSPTNDPRSPGASISDIEIAGIIVAITITLLIVILLVIIGGIVVYRSRNTEKYSLNGVNGGALHDGGTLAGGDFEKDLELDASHNSAPRII